MKKTSKKILSLFLSAIILTSSFCITNVFASQNDSNEIISSADENFETSNDVLAQEGLKAPTADEDLSLKYDKDLVTYSEYCDQLPDSYVSKTDKDVLVKKYINKYDFQTCRLIVGHLGDFDYKGAIDSFDINSQAIMLQYKNEKDTKAAYEYYSNCDKIEYVDIDSVYESSSISSNEYGNIDTDTYLSWAADMIKTKESKDYILANTNELQDVVVAVMDSGVQADAIPNFLIHGYHEFLNERFVGGLGVGYISTYKYNSIYHEYFGALDVRGHGTQVAGVVVDNTLPNVKIASVAMFGEKQADGSGKAPTTYEIAQTIYDLFYWGYHDLDDNRKFDASILNISLENESSADSEFLNRQCNYWSSQGKIIIAAAGNGGLNTKYNKVYPGAADSVIAVGSVGKNGDRSSFSNYGERVDIYAPGENIKTSYCGDNYKIKDEYYTNGYTEATGTSFSAPIVSAVCAMVKTMYPNENGMQIVKRVVKSKDLNGVVNMYRALQGDTPTVPTADSPTLSLASGTYNNEQQLTVTTSSDNATIYYTDDGSEPSPASTKYTSGKVLNINESITYKFIAFESGKMVSEVSTGEYIIPIYEENGWKMYNDGTIFDYVGEVKDEYIVPELIEGIEPTAFKKIAKSNDIGLGTTYKSITLPMSITTIKDSAFRHQSELTTFVGKGVVNIGEYAFSDCMLLENTTFANKVDYLGSFAFSESTAFYNVAPFKHFTMLNEAVFSETSVTDGNWQFLETIGKNAFNSTLIKDVNMENVTETGIGSFFLCPLETVYLPNLKIARASTFGATTIKSIHLPKVEVIGSQLFSYCDNLEKIELDDMPNFVTTTERLHQYWIFRNSSIKILELNLDHIESDFLSCTALDYLYLPNATYIYDESFSECSCKRMEFNKVTRLVPTDADIIAAPSTVTYIRRTNTFKSDVKLYGTEGTYVSQWAEKNNYNFINISQETALLEDLPEQINDINTVLQPDIIGFNRTYQWYANTVADNTTGTPIDGATSKKFIPANYPKSQYYYCVCTSTDEGYDPVIIRTGTTKNNDYTSADYSSVESAKANIPADLSKYTTDSVNALNVVLNGINYGLSTQEQSTVDDYAIAIQNAINALVLISDDTTTTKPNETTTTTQKPSETTTTTTNETLSTTQKASETTNKSETTTITTTNKSISSTKNKYQDKSKTSPYTGIDNWLPLAFLLVLCGFVLLIRILRFTNKELSKSNK